MSIKTTYTGHFLVVKALKPLYLKAFQMGYLNPTFSYNTFRQHGQGLLPLLTTRLGLLKLQTTYSGHIL